MNCFSIESNHRINKFFNDFYEVIGDVYPEALSNFRQCVLEKVSGWPCPDFDLTMLYLSIGYDHHHPTNRHKEIIRQKGTIRIENEDYEFEFCGSQNVIDRFRLPKGFHKSFEFDTITIKSSLLPILVNNRRARKKFKNALKKDFKTYMKLINPEELFITQIDNKNYLSIIGFESNKFLAFDRKYNSYILTYKEPNWLEDNENQYRNFEERSEVENLNMNINEILKMMKERNKIGKLLSNIASR